MKQFEIYRNIRKGAVIFGLPVSSFAIMMICIIASLLVVIFSFNFWIIIGVLIFNCALYLVLIRINNMLQLFQLRAMFPDIISNKRNSGFDYDKN
ncbi:hypothetical protein FHG64_12780 [Antarcticibacterium flavum]|uniref:Uncharacterized protein n=1 Tax=Antarcticibacterium flavum TaxID=2058175 RepID=A0A5B7X4F8_9FLAO|nr:hypothetical protein [Antarcticibacterium sp. W02-3]QCY70209.1 hypothetical protein FHG64_12780 [Antarcticibacterium flavum]